MHLTCSLPALLALLVYIPIMLELMSAVHAPPYHSIHCCSLTAICLAQMEKEKRKRAASRAPKQHVNKKGRSEKPAVTQGRRSKFTAMSAQTVTSEDDDAETHQHKRSVTFVWL